MYDASDMDSMDELYSSDTAMHSDDADVYEFGDNENDDSDDSSVHRQQVILELRRYNLVIVSLRLIDYLITGKSFIQFVFWFRLKCLSSPLSFVIKT